MNKIITISREFGSGGRTIGRRVAEILGIPCYDQEIIEQVADESGFAKDYVEEYGEYKSSGGWLSDAFSVANSTLGGMSNSDVLWVTQRKVILDLAQKGPCVFVGRCADYILENKAELIKVFIHSDLECRSKRIVEMYGENSVTPEKRLKVKDKRRAAYYRFYTETEWGLAKNYTLCLNSGEIGIENCANIIANLYKTENCE